VLSGTPPPGVPLSTYPESSPPPNRLRAHNELRNEATTCDRQYLAGTTTRAVICSGPVVVATSPLCAVHGLDASTWRTVAAVANRGDHTPHAPKQGSPSPITTVAGMWLLTGPHLRGRTRLRRHRGRDSSRRSPRFDLRAQGGSQCLPSAAFRRLVSPAPGSSTQRTGSLMFNLFGVVWCSSCGGWGACMPRR
jgi:hypothetical protein